MAGTKTGNPADSHSTLGRPMGAIVPCSFLLLPHFVGRPEIFLSPISGHPTPKLRGSLKTAIFELFFFLQKLKFKEKINTFEGKSDVDIFLMHHYDPLLFNQMPYKK